MEYLPQLRANPDFKPSFLEKGSAPSLSQNGQYWHAASQEYNSAWNQRCSITSDSRQSETSLRYARSVAMKLWTCLGFVLVPVPTSASEEPWIEGSDSDELGSAFAASDRDSGDCTVSLFDWLDIPVCALVSTRGTVGIESTFGSACFSWRSLACALDGIGLISQNFFWTDEAFTSLFLAALPAGDNPISSWVYMAVHSRLGPESSGNESVGTAGLAAK